MCHSVRGGLAAVAGLWGASLIGETPRSLGRTTRTKRQLRESRGVVAQCLALDVLSGLCCSENVVHNTSNGSERRHCSLKLCTFRVPVPFT